MPTVYCVEDDHILSTLMVRYFEQATFQARRFSRGKEFLECFLYSPCDLVLLDLSLPDIDGTEVLRRLRVYSQVPVIAVTARNAELDSVQTLADGADIYIPKPFRPAVLVAHAQALLRRSTVGGRSTLSNNHIGDLEFLSAGVIMCNGKVLPLAPKEEALLRRLAQQSPSCVERSVLLSELWGLPANAPTRAVDESVRRLRHALTKARSKMIIETVWGRGFRLKEGGCGVNKQSQGGTK